MGNSLRCCIACMIPCGNLDVVRVLHADGRVDEYSRSITAGEVMKANPKHVVAQPICEGLVKKPSLLHPEAELQKGKIYFLIPTYSLHKKSKSKSKNSEVRSSTNGLADVSTVVPALPPPKVEPATRLERACHRRRRVMVQRGKIWKPVLENIQEEVEPFS